MELDNVVATFNEAGNDGRRRQVQIALTFADDELKKRDTQNPDIETLELAELKKRSLECDRLFRSGKLNDSSHRAELEDSFGWVVAAFTNVCMLEGRADLIDTVNATA